MAGRENGESKGKIIFCEAEIDQEYKEEARYQSEIDTEDCITADIE